MAVRNGPLMDRFRVAVVNWEKKLRHVRNLVFVNTQSGNPNTRFSVH